MTESPMVSPVYRLASEYVDGVAARNPIAATSLGVPGYDDQLPDMSPVGAQSRASSRWYSTIWLRAPRPDAGFQGGPNPALR